jgi:multisubunit Na+/H+ antiporter MnhC subunit
VLALALALTGIVVGVATLGVALSVVSAIYRQYESLDEDEILKRLG